MKILVVGGTGTIGKAVVDDLKQNHQVIAVGRNSGSLQVNLTKVSSIEALLNHVGKVDAIVGAAGEAPWKSFGDLTEEHYYQAIKSKLMGQVNLAKLGARYLNPMGSITLTTGILADRPVPQTAAAALVNGAIHSFIQAVALESTGSFRINAVSPGLVEASAEKYQEFFPGHIPIPMEQVTQAYRRSIEGRESGLVIRIYP